MVKIKPAPHPTKLRQHAVSRFFTMDSLSPLTSASRAYIDKVLHIVNYLYMHWYIYSVKSSPRDFLT